MFTKVAACMFHPGKFAGRHPSSGLEDAGVVRAHYVEQDVGGALNLSWLQTN
jgi:hypothetical protein